MNIEKAEFDRIIENLRNTPIRPHQRNNKPSNPETKTVICSFCGEILFENEVAHKLINIMQDPKVRYFCNSQEKNDWISLKLKGD